jgi:hypothetical protein
MPRIDFVPLGRTKLGKKELFPHNISAITIVPRYNTLPVLRDNCGHEYLREKICHYFKDS